MSDIRKVLFYETTPSPASEALLDTLLMLDLGIHSQGEVSVDSKTPSLFFSCLNQKETLEVKKMPIIRPPQTSTRTDNMRSCLKCSFRSFLKYVILVERDSNGDDVLDHIFVWDTG